MFDPLKRHEIEEKKRADILQKQQIIHVTSFFRNKINQIYCLSAIPDDDIHIMITEIKCNEPDCVPIETLCIITMDESKYGDSIYPCKSMSKLLKPLREVRLEDVLSIELPFSYVESKLFKDKFEELIKPFRDLGISLLEQAKMNDIISYLEKTVADMKDNQPQKVEPLPRTSKFMDNVEKINDKEEVTRVVMTSSKVENQVVRPISQRDSFTVKSSESLNAQYVVPPRRTNSSQYSGSPSISFSGPTVVPRHEKEKKRRGCPCCDPDNIDNILDKMMFMDTPPN